MFSHSLARFNSLVIVAFLLINLIPLPCAAQGTPLHSAPEVAAHELALAPTVQTSGAWFAAPANATTGLFLPAIEPVGHGPEAKSLTSAARPTSPASEPAPALRHRERLLSLRLDGRLCRHLSLQPTH